MMEEVVRAFAGGGRGSGEANSVGRSPDNRCGEEHVAQVWQLGGEEVGGSSDLWQGPPSSIPA
jgi:hypothetical protein